MSSFSLYNPVDSTHRGRVIWESMMNYQLEQAKEQTTSKLEDLVSNLVSGTTAIIDSPTIVDGAITSIEILNPGKNYITANVSINGDGTGASATATLTGGRVTGFTITSHGSGYSSAGTTVVVAGSGTGATGLSLIEDGVINSDNIINIINSGNNYLFPPLVSISSSSGTGATAVATIVDGKVNSINIVKSGSGYVIPIFLTVASPDKAPNIDQRTLLYNQYFADFTRDIDVRNVDYINARYNQGRLIQATKADSLTAITNPIVAYGNRDIKKRVLPPQIPEITVPDLVHECYFSIHNDGKSPSQEYLFTHDRRIGRNSSSSHILKKANEVVMQQVDHIIANGGVGALLSAKTITGAGRLTEIDVDEGGLYFTTNPPIVSIRRTENDPGKVHVVAVVNAGGEITEIIVENRTTNIGYVDTHIPLVVISGDSGATATAVVVGDKVDSIIVNNGGLGYNPIAPPKISVYRITGDPGLATASATTVDPSTGQILTVSITNSGTNIGYRSDYPPDIRVSGGKGAVTALQKAALLELALDDAFSHLEPNWSETSTRLPSTLNACCSTSIVENKRSLHIVDVNDKLTRNQRLDYKDSERIKLLKAESTALARYSQAIKDGIIPNLPAIPDPPILPTATILSSSRGSGAVLTTTISNNGKISNINIIQSGSDYPKPTTVVIKGGGPNAKNARAFPIITNGAIEDIILENNGIDYTEDPVVEILEGGGTSAVGTPTVVNFEVTDIVVHPSGSNYMSVVITGGGGTGAKISAITENGKITGFNIINPGSGFNVQESPNPKYLEYLREALIVPNLNVPPTPDQEPPTSDKLPEPTLKNSKDVKGFLNNQSINNRNYQRTEVRRAASSVIEIAQLARKDAYLQWLDYIRLDTSQSLINSYNSTVKASKATKAALNLKRWKPVSRDPYMKHINQVFALYRATIPAWDATTTYTYGTVINYSATDTIYKITHPHRPADYGQLPNGDWMVSPVRDLNHWYILFPINPNEIH